MEAWIACCRDRHYSLIPDHEHMAVVLRINLAIRTERERGIRRSYREVQKHRLLRFREYASISLRECVKIAVLTVRVHCAVHINCRRIDAPFKAVGVVGDAIERTIGIAGAALVC